MNRVNDIKNDHKFCLFEFSDGGKYIWTFASNDAFIIYDTQNKFLKLDSVKQILKNMNKGIL